MNDEPQDTPPRRELTPAERRETVNFGFVTLVGLTADFCTLLRDEHGRKCRCHLCAHARIVGGVLKTARAAIEDLPDAPAAEPK